MIQDFVVITGFSGAGSSSATLSSTPASAARRSNVASIAGS